MTPLQFSELDMDWTHEEVFLIGGGPSLRGFDFSCLRGRGITVGVNKSAWESPGLRITDYMVTLDQHFAATHRDRIAEYVSQGGRAILAMPANESGHEAVPAATYVLRQRNMGRLSIHPNVVFGTNSGYAALGVTFLAKTITESSDPGPVSLLGYDMGYSQSGVTHHHSGYGPRGTAASHVYRKWTRQFDEVASQLAQSGISVINYVGPEGSMISAYEKRPLEDLSHGKKEMGSTVEADQRARSQDRC